MITWVVRNESCWTGPWWTGCCPSPGPPHGPSAHPSTWPNTQISSQQKMTNFSIFPAKLKTRMCNLFPPPHPLTRSRSSSSSSYSLLLILLFILPLAPPPLPITSRPYSSSYHLNLSPPPIPSRSQLVLRPSSSFYSVAPFTSFHTLVPLFFMPLGLPPPPPGLPKLPYPSTGTHL